MERAEGAGPARGQDLSISFVVTTVHDAARVAPLLQVLTAAASPDDEIILLMREEQAASAGPPPGVQVVGVPDASVYRLRAQMPAACRKSWIVLLEDHAMIDGDTVAAIRALIRSRPDIDLIPFLAKNLASTRPWEWAIFLHTFAPVWAPLDRPPPFSPVTSAIVRRSSLGAAPLRDGEWELEFIPRLYAGGRWAHSNDIFIDHVKPLSFAGAIAITFHNARAGAANQLKLGFPKENVLREARYVFADRARELMQLVKPRERDLPSGTERRLRTIGLVHCLGNLATCYFGEGRSRYKLD
jgi:hypothetical protein